MVSRVGLTYVNGVGGLSAESPEIAEKYVRCLPIGAFPGARAGLLLAGEQCREPVAPFIGERHVAALVLRLDGRLFAQQRFVVAAKALDRETRLIRVLAERDEGGQGGLQRGAEGLATSMKSAPVRPRR